MTFGPPSPGPVLLRSEGRLVGRPGTGLAKRDGHGGRTVALVAPLALQPVQGG